MSHCDELLRFCESHSCIYCYGAGYMGQRTATFLKKYGIRIQGYLVSVKTESFVLGIDVWQLDEKIDNISKGTGIILSLDERYHAEIIDKFKQYGLIDGLDFFYMTAGEVAEKIMPDLAESGSCFYKVMFRLLEDMKKYEDDKVVEYEKRYCELRQRYKKIVLSEYDMRAIGVMCITYYLWSIETNGEKDVLYVMNPIMHGRRDIVPNMYLYNEIRKKIEFITKDNYGFWRWVIQYHMDEVEFSDKYSMTEVLKRDTAYRNFKYHSPLQVILDSEEECIVEKMQLGKEFICIFSRDNEYYKYRGLESDADAYRYNTDARNTSISDFELLGVEYEKKGISLVRMGWKIAERIGSWAVDYANDYRTEKLDFYLISKCKFLVFGDSGIVAIGVLFKKPLVLVNQTCISCSGDVNMPLSSDKDLIITKKLWYQKQNRYLTLDEMLFMEGKFTTRDLYTAYHDIGVVFHSNSPEEILDVAEEMRNRLDGNYVYTEEDEMLQEQYRSILEKNINISKNHYSDGRFGAGFLRKNGWFLEDISEDLSIKSKFCGFA